MFYPDVVDYVEPTMLIVGSRGLGQLNGQVDFLCLLFNIPNSSCAAKVFYWVPRPTISLR